MISIIVIAMMSSTIEYPEAPVFLFRFLMFF